jgi:6-phosphogluconolactonase
MKGRMTYRMFGVVIVCLVVGQFFAFSGLPGALANNAAVSTATNIDDDDSDSRGSFLYVLTNPNGPNAVDAFSRNRQNGKLTFLGRFFTGGVGNFDVGASQQHSLVFNDGRLYAVNPGSNNISVMAIRDDGSLQLLSLTPSGGPSPVSIAIHDDLLYVANQGDPVFDPGDPSTPGTNIGNYTGFRIGDDGRLKRIENSTVQLDPGDTPTDLIFNPPGDLLIGARVHGRIIDTFRVNPNGRLTRAALLRNQPGPFGITFSPVHHNQLFAASFFLPGANSYNVSNRGEVNEVSQSADPTPGEDNCWTAFTRDGRSLWTASFEPNIISLFLVSPSGALEFQSAHKEEEARGESTVSDIAVDSAGRFLYSLRPFPIEAIKIHVMRITSTPSLNGGLADVQDAFMPPFIGPDGTDSRGPMGLVLVESLRGGDD